MGLAFCMHGEGLLSILIDGQMVCLSLIIVGQEKEVGRCVDMSIQNVGCSSDEVTLWNGKIVSWKTTPCNIKNLLAMSNRWYAFISDR